MTSILVVDDEVTIRELLVDLLAGEGYMVASANNGFQALASLRESPPDLVLMDIMMPELDGREVLRQMRDEADLKHIPVIVMSAAFAKDQDGSLATAFMAKPFDLNALLRTIDRILDRDH